GGRDDGAPDPDRVAATGRSGAQPRQAGRPAATPAGGVGSDVPDRDGVPAPVPETPAPQAGGRSGAPPAPADRARDGLPFPAMIGSLGREQDLLSVTGGLA